MKFSFPVLSALSIIASATASTAATAQASPSPYTSATRYDAIGRLVGTIAPDPDGGGALRHAATRTTYDARGNPIKVETGQLSSWKSETILPANWGSAFTVLSSVEVTYDTLNRKISERVKGSNGVTVSLTQYSYDNHGRLECTAVRMNPATYSSLPSSACALGMQGVNGPDRITRTVYDGFGQVLQVRKAVGTSVEIADVTYTYTENGQIAQVIDANGNRAEQRYDGHDRLTRWVFPSKSRPSSFNASTYATAVSSAGSLNNGDYESYTYDDSGNRLSLRKRDGSTLTYQYDALDRMTRKTVPSRSGLSSTRTRDVFYSYDLQGRPLRTRFDSLNGAGQTNTYDALGRLVNTSDNSSGATRNLGYQYDRNGNRTRITQSDNQFFNYQYDGLNRLRNITLSNGSGFALHEYNTRGTLDLVNSGGVSNYDYDPAGRLDQINLNLGGTSRDVTWSYTRNPASQITSETQSNDAYSWNGHVNVSRNYVTNGLNQYQSAGGSNFTYDANGNLTADGSSTYQYDIENRLVRVTFNGYTVHLYYDPLGRLYRTSSNQPGFGQINFLYDGNALVAEYASNGVILNRYVHGSNVEADDPIAWFTGSAVSTSNGRFAKSDPRGSIVSWTNWGSTSLITNTYDEYGINGSSNQGRFQYTGQAWVPEIGMYYYKARIYSPTLGRFLQTDPIGYEDQYNLYAYVGNDPLNKIDPTGLSQRGTNNHVLDPAQVASLEAEQKALTEKRSNGGLSRTEQKRLREVNGKLKRHRKAVGITHSRGGQSGRGRLRAGGGLLGFLGGLLGAYADSQSQNASNFSDNTLLRASRGLAEEIDLCGTTQGCSAEAREGTDCGDRDCTDEEVEEQLRDQRRKVQEALNERGLIALLMRGYSYARI